MGSLFYFLLAVTLLVAVHEYGHYRVAVACDVKVLRFSVGFGRVLFRWKPRRPRPGQARLDPVGPGLVAVGQQRGDHGWIILICIHQRCQLHCVTGLPGADHGGHFLVNFGQGRDNAEQVAALDLGREGIK